MCFLSTGIRIRIFGMVTYFDDTHLIKFGATLGPAGGELATLRKRLAEGVPDRSRGEFGQVLN